MSRVSVAKGKEEEELYSLPYVLQKAERNIRIIVISKYLLPEADRVALYAEAIGLLSLGKRLAREEGVGTSEIEKMISFLNGKIFPFHAASKRWQVKKAAMEKAFAEDLAKVDAAIDAEEIPPEEEEEEEP